MEGLHLDQAQLERLVELDRKFSREGLTFDDVLLVPAESSVLPNDVSTATRLTRGITIEIPIVSAAMDTVTEARLAIALAREGGLGIVHRNLSIDAQLAEVDKVNRSESGMIVEPVTLPRAAGACVSGRRSVSGPTRGSAPARCWTRASTCSSSTPRMGIPLQSRRWCGGSNPSGTCRSSPATLRPLRRRRRSCMPGQMPSRSV